MKKMLENKKIAELDLKFKYDSEGRVIMDTGVLNLLLREHDELVDKRAEVSGLKDDLAAMTAYAEMFERGEIGVPGAEGSNVVTEKLTQLYTKLEMYEKEPKKSYVEQIMELQDEVKALKRRLHWIWAIGVDYDGCGTVKSLKELIDEMVDFTQMSDEQVDDQLKAVKQMKQSLIELSTQKDELINQVQRLQRYDAERDERLHARLSDEAYKKGTIDAATKIAHYLYPFWQDTTSKNVAIGSCLDWIKATFGV